MEQMEQYIATFDDNNNTLSLSGKTIMDTVNSSTPITNCLIKHAYDTDPNSDNYIGKATPGEILAISNLTSRETGIALISAGIIELLNTKKPSKIILDMNGVERLSMSDNKLLGSWVNDAYKKGITIQAVNTTKTVGDKLKKAAPGIITILKNTNNSLADTLQSEK